MSLGGAGCIVAVHLGGAGHLVAVPLRGAGCIVAVLLGGAGIELKCPSGAPVGSNLRCVQLLCCALGGLALSLNAVVLRPSGVRHLILYKQVWRTLGGAILLLSFTCVAGGEAWHGEKHCCACGS